MIPSVAVVRIQHPRNCTAGRSRNVSRDFGLWLPLFWLWIPLLLLAPLVLLVLLVVCLGLRVSFWNSISVFWGILCSLPGTNVHVRADGTQVLVRIF
jgi:hypothetical protein